MMPFGNCTINDNILLGQVGDVPLALAVSTNYPIEFYEITNAITKLTGLGSELGKAKSSGKTPK